MDNGNLFQWYYAVSLRQFSDDSELIGDGDVEEYWIEFYWADNENHCVEQVKNANPRAEILAMRVAAS